MAIIPSNWNERMIACFLAYTYAGNDESFKRLGTAELFRFTSLIPTPQLHLNVFLGNLEFLAGPQQNSEFSVQSGIIQIWEFLPYKLVETFIVYNNTFYVL